LCVYNDRVLRLVTLCLAVLFTTAVAPRQQVPGERRSGRSVRDAVRIDIE
jgi:hypothetical protein